MLYRWRNADWARSVVDPKIGLARGVIGADLDGTGSQTLVVADRGEDRRGVYLYSWPGPGDGDWVKETLDASMPASSCAAGDIDGDRRIDLVCVGRATEEPTWYRNVTQ